MSVQFCPPCSDSLADLLLQLSWEGAGPAEPVPKACLAFACLLPAKRHRSHQRVLWAPVQAALSLTLWLQVHFSLSASSLSAQAKRHGLHGLQVCTVLALSCCLLLQLSTCRCLQTHGSHWPAISPPRRWPGRSQPAHPAAAHCARPGSPCDHQQVPAGRRPVRAREHLASVRAAVSAEVRCTKPSAGALPCLSHRPHTAGRTQLLPRPASGAASDSSLLCEQKWQPAMSQSTRCACHTALRWRRTCPSAQSAWRSLRVSCCSSCQASASSPSGTCHGPCLATRQRGNGPKT